MNEKNYLCKEEKLKIHFKDHTNVLPCLFYFPKLKQTQITSNKTTTKTSLYYQFLNVRNKILQVQDIFKAFHVHLKFLLLNRFVLIRNLYIGDNLRRNVCVQSLNGFR